MTQSDSKRRTLRRLAAMGALGSAGLSGWLSEALAKGDLPTVPGVNDLAGAVTVNGVPAKAGTPVKVGDQVSTGGDGRAVVVLGKDAYLLRAGTKVTFEADEKRGGALAGVAIATGKLLSVFGKRKDGEVGVNLKPPNATVGIRGTGAYLEVQDGRTYFCLCYGEAAITGQGMSEARLVKTQHHESPLWLDDRGGIMKVEKAPMLSHTDDELILLEKLQGRVPPFVAQGLTGRY